MTVSSEQQLLNLLYRYAEYIDSGDFVGASELFRHARIRSAHGELGPDEVLALWREMIIIYPDGTPRTKHMITNPIVDVDEAAGTATIRSYYTVVQQVDDAPLRTITAGRYHDQFERVEGAWRFVWRDYSLHDLPGELSGHLHGWKNGG
ncbi:nuclear transport factor 2 family protein [soil metagenome]